MGLRESTRRISQRLGGPGTPRGYFDGVVEGFLTGWCPSQSRTPSVVDIYFGDHLACSRRADLLRPDLSGVVADLNCGFAFPMDEVEVAIIAVQRNFDIDRGQLSARSRDGRVLPGSSAPISVEELKLVFALNLLSRRYDGRISVHEASIGVF